MRRKFWLGLVLTLVSLSTCALEVGMATAVSGTVRFGGEQVAAGGLSTLNAFVKVREGDVLTMDKVARLQLVYFDGGRQETWEGSGTLGIGSSSSRVLKGNPQSAVKTLPAILVRQLTKTPYPDGSVVIGMIRVRSVAATETLNAAEKNYRSWRAQSEPDDFSPELYLLAAYFELRELDKVETLLQKMRNDVPNYPEIDALTALYTRAVASARIAAAK